MASEDLILRVAVNDAEVRAFINRLSSISSTPMGGVTRSTREVGVAAKKASVDIGNLRREMARANKEAVIGSDGLTRSQREGVAAAGKLLQAQERLSAKAKAIRPELRLGDVVNESMRKAAAETRKFERELDRASAAYAKVIRANAEFQRRMEQSARPHGPLTTSPGASAAMSGPEALAASQMAGLFSTERGGINAAANQQSRAIRTLSTQYKGLRSELSLTHHRAQSLNQTLASTGAVGAKGAARVERGAKSMGAAIGRSATQAQFLRGVLEAFLLYKGFAFLQFQVVEFTKSLVDLEHEVGLVQTQLSDLGGDFRPQITAQVTRIAQETGLAFSAVAKAEFEVVSANIALAESYEVLTLSAKAAVAGNGEVELAFNAALTQVNAFSLAIRDFGAVYDKQFNLVKRGIFTYEQLATVVGNVSIAFGGMGQEVAVANAALAAISQVFTGSQLEQGATGLRNAVLRMTNSFQQFEEFGLDVVNDASGEFNDFIDIIKELSAVLGGLSPAARSAVLKDLFPDKRERRGIEVLLRQTAELEQFYIEQKFSAGDLNDAYQTVNESLLQQARILRNDLVPAFEPLVATLGAMATGINNLNDSLPGFTENLIRFAAVAAVVGGGRLVLGAGGRLSGGAGLALTSRAALQGPTQAGAAGLGSVRTLTPLGRGAGLTGAAIGGVALSGAGGRVGGAGGDLMSILGGGISGAATGALIGGGAPGAIVGAVAGIGIALVDAMSDAAPEAAKSFSESFADELANRGGDIAAAFISATATQSGSASLGLANALFTSSQITQTAPGPGAGNPISILKDSLGFDPKNPLQTTTVIGGRSASDKRGEVIEGVLQLRNAEVTIERATGSTITSEDREFLASQIANQRFEGMDPATVDSLGALIGLLSDPRIDANATELDAALNTFIDATSAGATESEALANVLSDLRATTEGVGVNLKTLGAEISAAVTGDFSLAADVFSRMGSEGQNLADVFTRISVAVNAFGALETLQGTTIARDVFKGTDVPVDAEFKRALEQLGMGGQVVSQDQSILEILGLDSNVVAQGILDRILADAGLIEGKFDNDDFIEALLGGGAPQLELGVSGLADSLFDASDAVRAGLVDGLGLTADHLEMLGEELQGLNKIIRQKAILEEFQSIADFAGADFDMGATMGHLRDQMLVGGQSFIDLLSDPAKVAELLANLQFGDVKIDQSEGDTNVVVRISGNADLDLLQTTEAAESFLDNILAEKTRRGTRF